MAEILKEIPKIKIDPKAEPVLKVKTLKGDLYFGAESIRDPEA